MRKQAIFLLAMLSAVGVFVLGAAGCGSDQTASDEVPGEPPSLSIPKSGSDDPLADEGSNNPSSRDRNQDEDTKSTDESTDSSADTGTTAEPPAQQDSGGNTGADTGDTTGQTGGATGGTPTQGGQEPQNNEQQAPEGSGAQKFEEFCDQNPGAC
jgi:hypothetical protein